MSGDWARVLAYVVQAAEDQRQAEELAARAHAGRVMAKKIIDQKLGGCGRKPGGSASGRHRRLGGRGGETGGVA